MYEGRDETFTDTNLTNGKKYHYSLFTHDDGTTAQGYSKPVFVAMLPSDGVEQFVFRESVSAPPPVGGELKFGMRSDEVTGLQKMLAADPSVYPEGLVTGYFGPYTLAGVKHFQSLHGLPPTGVVSTLTRAKIQALR